MSDSAVDIGRRRTHVSLDAPESTYAWTRLLAALLLSGIGGVGMWSVIVALPAIQADFGVARSAASLPYTATMVCFGFGGILAGPLRSLRRHHPRRRRGPFPGPRLRARQPGDDPLAVRDRPGPARRRGQLGDL